MFFEVVSVSHEPLHRLADRAATVLDGAGTLAPDRGRVSARTRRLDDGGFRQLVASVTAPQLHDGLWAIFEQRDEGLWGDLRIFSDTNLATAPRFHEAGFHLPAERLLAQPAQLERAVQLMCDLFVAMDGFYGKADTAAMRRRRLGLRGGAADDGRMWIPRWDDPRFVIWDRWVEDVWWLNLFGPAYIDRWGRQKVEGLGARRQRLTGGGLAVWSTDLPADPMESELISGYAHKQPFYEVLNLETFIHESMVIPEPGVRVPPLTEHARRRP